ncbi:MAG: O-antigen ligase family protein, partial [Spirochaetes bacterium]|nr:O-antigen ligase family protein [Spirochaetota bacterium]
SLLFFLYLKDLNEIKTGLICIITFMVILFFWGIIEFNVFRADLMDNGIHESLLTSLSKFRPKLSFGNTNYFAGYLLGLLPLACISPFVMFKKIENHQKRFLVRIIVFTLIFLIGLGSLIMTQCTGTIPGIYLGMLVFMLTITFISDINKKIKTLLLILICVFFILAPVLIFTNPDIIKPIHPRLAYKVNNLDYSFQDRMNGWIGGLELFKKHPVFGAGLGTVYAASFKYASKFFYLYSKSSSFKHSHSEYIEVLAEGGLLGMFLFLFLVGSVIFLLLRNIYFRKYSKDYQLIALGVVAGILGMLGHQFFSLTLRMSVTMSVFFSLLGIGLFLLSYGDFLNESEKKSKKNKNESLDSNTVFSLMLDYKKGLVVIGVLVLLLIISFFLFLPLYSAETNVAKVLPIGAHPNKDTNFQLKKAIKNMPNNPYIWTYKYTFDFEIQLMREGNRSNIQEPEKLLDFLEKRYLEVERDLDTLNKIIPDYQDVWSKYVNLYLIRSNYLKALSTRINTYQGLNLKNEYIKTRKLMLKNIDRSLSKNFLNISNHVYKLIILSEFGEKEHYRNVLKDYMLSQIMIKNSKSKLRLVKEQCEIKFSDEPNQVQKRNEKYYFNIDEGWISELTEKYFQYQDINTLFSSLKNETKKLFEIYEQL